MPARRRDPVSVPRTFHSSSRTYPSHDYSIDDSISRAGYFSNAVLDDTDLAAAHSRAKDYDLLRNTQSAIRHPSPSDSVRSRISRSATRYMSLPPADRKTTATSSSTLTSRSSLSPSSLSSSSNRHTALSPHQSRRLQELRTALETPPPSSLLSSKISTFLSGKSALPLGVRPATNSLVSYKSFLDSATPLPPPPPRKHDSMSIVSYKSHLSDPSVSSPFTTRSSSRLYPSSCLSSLPPYSRFRSNSLPRYNISLSGGDQDEDYDYGGSDDYEEEDYEPPSHRRNYGRRAIAAPSSSSRPSSTLYYRSYSPAGSDDDDYDDYSLVSEDRGTYSSYYNPRPPGVSPTSLSSYEGPHDGSYEADMADIYDYVPFGPSRQGILELTQHPSSSYSPSIQIVDANDDDDEDNSGVDSSFIPYSPSYSSSTLLTTFPNLNSPHSSYSPSSPSIIPSVSLYPKPSFSSDLTSTTPYSPVSSSLAHNNNSIFDSVLSSTAARARAALQDSHQLSDYGNASLVMSVEGSAVSADGKDRYGFKYYPPPIPLKGSGVSGLDERILGVTPKVGNSPADSFFSDYLNRLKSLRSEITDRDESCSRSGLGSGGGSSDDRSVVSVPRPFSSYAHTTVHLPLHIAGRQHSVPVSSYRSRADDHGLSHRVDVFPLVESRATLGKDKIELPLYRAGGGGASGGGDYSKLTMLEKINIKAAIIGSKMETEDGGKSKKKPRPLYHVDKSREPSAGSSQQSSIFNDGPVQSGGLHSSRPPLPKPTDRKAIRTVDGFTKPKNVMSWEHRVESRISPDDLIYQPQSISRLREQVRGCRDKLDRHRQLMDRSKSSSSGDSNNVSTPSSSVKIPDYYYAGADPKNPPMSDVRRRVRRTLAKTKN